VRLGVVQLYIINDACIHSIRFITCWCNGEMRYGCMRVYVQVFNFPITHFHHSTLRIAADVPVQEDPSIDA